MPSKDWKLDGVATLVTDPPHGYSTTMQNQHICNHSLNVAITWLCAVEEFRWGGSATNRATLSCFQGSHLTPNFKSPRTGLFNRIELVQGLLLKDFGTEESERCSSEGGGGSEQSCISSAKDFPRLGYHQADVPPPLQGPVHPHMWHRPPHQEAAGQAAAEVAVQHQLWRECQIVNSFWQH